MLVGENTGLNWLKKLWFCQDAGLNVLKITISSKCVKKAWFYRNQVIETARVADIHVCYMISCPNCPVVTTAPILQSLNRLFIIWCCRKTIVCWVNSWRQKPEMSTEGISLPSYGVPVSMAEPARYSWCYSKVFYRSRDIGRGGGGASRLCQLRGVRLF